MDGSQKRSEAAFHAPITALMETAPSNSGHVLSSGNLRCEAAQLVPQASVLRETSRTVPSLSEMPYA